MAMSEEQGEFGALNGVVRGRSVALHPSDDGQPTGIHWRGLDQVHNWPALARQSPPAPLHFLAEPEDSEA